MSSERASVPVKTTDTVTFDTTDALPLNTPVHPYTGLPVPCARTRGYSSRFDTTDAQIVRPYNGYTSRRSTTDYSSCFDTPPTGTVSPSSPTHKGSINWQRPAPWVVRGFAPPTHGYDSSDLLRGPFARHYTCSETWGRSVSVKLKVIGGDLRSDDGDYGLYGASPT